MEAAVLPIPRLRLTRNGSSYETAGAGPSRDRFQDLPATGDSQDDSGDEDQLPTPRMTSTAALLSTAETPAARLRALLSRVPTSTTSTPMPPPKVHTPSEIESDFEPPDGYPATPSMARDSLKDIFSRALREPGDTPQKDSTRQRRNSVDVSEVEASPRVQRERANNKGKRRSLSDEEIENPSKSQRSEASFRSSQATTFDILREKLMNSHTQIKDQHLPGSHYEEDSIPDDDSHDTATLLRDFNSSHSTPPAATSTPQQSLRMSTSSRFQSQSNLLDQDSEMQRAIEGLDSYEDSGLIQRPISFPSTTDTQAKKHKQTSPTSLPQRSHSALSLSHAKMHSFDKSHGSILTRRGSEEFRSSSRASSSHSSTDHHHDNDPDRMREREREWNKPKTPARAHTPDLRHQNSHTRLSSSGSPVTEVINNGALTRRGSSTSLHSHDGNSSKGSSFGSQAEYRERINELESERNAEREREWNKRNPKVPRPNSSLSVRSPTGSERVRTHSLGHLARPDSAQSQVPHIVPNHHHHHHRHDSFSNSSRASSPAGSSRASHSGKEDSAEEKIVHERERNWGAPRPKWTQHESTSSIPHHSSSSHLSSSTSIRVRAESLKSIGTAMGEAPVHLGKRSTELGVSAMDNAKRSSPRAPSPLPQDNHRRSPTLSRNSAHPLRSHSPLPPSDTATKKREHTHTSPSSMHKSHAQPKSHIPTSGSSSHFGYSLARNRAPLPPIDFEVSERSVPSNITAPSPTPGARPNSRTSGSAKSSHIPVRSPKKGESSSSVPKNHHTRISMESTHINSRRAESPSRSLAPPDQETNRVTNEDDEGGDSLSQERTPTIRTVLPPPLETPEHTPPRSPSPPLRQKMPVSDESRLQKALGMNNTTLTPTPISTSPNPVVQELSPPPSPPIELLPSSQDPQLPFPSTPPRQSSLKLAKVEFQTPSPPKGLPELPGPPSSSEGGEEGSESRTSIHDLRSNSTAMKTPRPPGAWASTPKPQLYHESSLEEHKDDRAETPTRGMHPDLTAMKTPRPPGTWSSPPVSQSHNQVSPPMHSLPDDSETEYDGGLATPVASLSRASPLPTQTPAPPGAWMATPGTRKSILKVRFDTDATGANPSFSSDAIESSNDFADGIANAPWRTENTPVDTEASTTDPKTLVKEEEPGARMRTPELPTPVSPSQSPRSSLRKSPGIRVLDAFGREQKPDNQSTREAPPPNTPRSKSGIRVVDAMGRDVASDEPTTEMSEMESDPPPKHNEALVRVRQGLSELAQGLDDMHRANDNHIDYPRLRKLNDESRAARATRERLSQSLFSAETDIRSKFEPLRASMKKSSFLIPAAIDRRLSRFQINSWTFWGFFILQLVLVLIMYRISVARAKDLFLTTYYDPFYPDLHLYIIKPDSFRHSMLSPSRTPWLSIPDTLRRDGWKASTGQIWNNLLITVGEWQQHIWEAWGSDSVQSNTSWPPT